MKILCEHQKRSLVFKYFCYHQISRGIDQFHYEDEDDNNEFEEDDNNYFEDHYNYNYYEASMLSILALEDFNMYDFFNILHMKTLIFCT
jgi:hypothetical protein